MSKSPRWKYVAHIHKTSRYPMFVSKISRSAQFILQDPKFPIILFHFRSIESIYTHTSVLTAEIWKIILLSFF